MTVRWPGGRPGGTLGGLASLVMSFVGRRSVSGLDQESLPCLWSGGKRFDGHLAGGGRYRASRAARQAMTGVIRNGKRPIGEPVSRLGLGHRTDRVAGLPNPNATRASM
jgi:hypothetical protein